jgi:hypothetical protein
LVSVDVAVTSVAGSPVALLAASATLILTAPHPVPDVMFVVLASITFLIPVAGCRP